MRPSLYVDTPASIKHRLIYCVWGSALPAGGIHVDHEFAEYLINQLGSSSQLGDRNEECDGLLQDGLMHFRTNMKRYFDSLTETYIINLGSRDFTDPALGISRGQMTVEG